MLKKIRNHESIQNVAIQGENLNQIEIAEMIEEMIMDMCNDFGISVENAIILVADYYGVEVCTIKSYLKSIDSQLTIQNNVVYFEDGNAVKLTAYSMRFKKLMNKVCFLVKQKVDDDIDIKFLAEFLSNQYGQYTRLEN